MRKILIKYQRKMARIVLAKKKNRENPILYKNYIDEKLHEQREYGKYILNESYIINEFTGEWSPDIKISGPSLSNQMPNMKENQSQNPSLREKPKRRKWLYAHK